MIVLPIVTGVLRGFFKRDSKISHEISIPEAGPIRISCFMSGSTGVIIAHQPKQCTIIFWGNPAKITIHLLLPVWSPTKMGNLMTPGWTCCHSDDLDDWGRVTPKDLWPFPGRRRTSGWTRARAVSWGRKQQVASNGKKLHDVGVFHDDWFRFWDPYINCLYFPYNWVGFHPLQQITRVNWSLKSKKALKSQICHCSSSSSSSSLAFLFLLFFEIDGDNSFSSLHDHPSGAGGPSEIFLEAYKHGSSTNKKWWHNKYTTQRVLFNNWQTNQICERTRSHNFLCQVAQVPRYILGQHSDKLPNINTLPSHGRLALHGFPRFSKSEGCFFLLEKILWKPSNLSNLTMGFCGQQNTF